MLTFLSYYVIIYVTNKKGRFLIMKKVWILEKRVSRVDVENTIAQFNLAFNFTKDETTREFITECINKQEAYLVDPNFTGYWEGFSGKSIYTQFCQEARHHIKQHDNFKFRVVTAWINDDATSWLGYKNPTENSGVLKYLYATA